MAKKVLQAIKSEQLSWLRQLFRESAHPMQKKDCFDSKFVRNTQHMWCVQFREYWASFNRTSVTSDRNFNKALHLEFLLLTRRALSRVHALMFCISKMIKCFNYILWLPTRCDRHKINLTLISYNLVSDASIDILGTLAVIVSATLFWKISIRRQLFNKKRTEVSKNR